MTDEWKPASRPPDSKRTVVVRLRHGGVDMGYYEGGRWLLVTGRPVNVEQWQERLLSPHFGRSRTKSRKRK